MKKIEKVLISIIAALPLIPFLNGTGCDFTIKHSSQNYEEMGVCKLGVLDIYVKNKSKNIILYQKQLYGLWGDLFITINLKASPLQRIDSNEIDTSLLFYENVLFSEFLIAHKKKSDEGDEYVLYSTYPKPTISNHHIEGRLSWISTVK